MAFSSADSSAFTVISRTGNATKSSSFSRISDVKEELASSWNSGAKSESFSRIADVKELSNSWSSSFSQGKLDRSSVYSVSNSSKQSTSSTLTCSSTTSSSKTIRTFSAKKTVTKKQTKTTKNPSTDENKESIDLTQDADNNDDKELEIAPSRHFSSLSGGSFFKAKYGKDMDGEDLFRSASSRFSMRNLNDSSGWTIDLDERDSLFPDFFPKNDAATKLSFEATWRAVSPVKEIGLAKQAIKNCSWEDEQKQENDAKKIVNSWMQFFGHVNTVKN